MTSIHPSQTRPTLPPAPPIRKARPEEIALYLHAYSAEQVATLTAIEQQGVGDLIQGRLGWDLHSENLLSLGDCRKLTKLRSWACELIGPVENQDFELFSAYPNLSELCISNSSLKISDEESGNRLFTLAQSHPGLKRLAFKWIDAFEDNKTGRTVLDVFPKLETLAVGWAKSSDASITHLFESALGHPALKELALPHTGSSGATLRAATEYLSKGGEVERLNLTGANRITAASLHAFSEALLTNQHIKSLSLSKSHLPQSLSSLEPLLDVLARHSTLENLDLSGCRLSESIAEEAMKQLTKNQMLRRLNLSGCQLGPAAFAVLRQAIQIGFPLEELNLQMSQLKVEEQISLVQACTENQHLRSLDISWNSREPEQGLELGKALAKLVQDNSTLEELNLSHLHLGTGGACEVLEALKTNSTLKSLYLQGTSTSAGELKKIEELLEHNTSLIRLHIGGNGLDRLNTEHIAFTVRLQKIQELRGCDFGLDFDYLLDPDYASGKEAHLDAQMNCVIC